MSETVLSKWRKRIANARKRKGFTPFEKKLSESWASCAIGEKYQLQGDAFCGTMSGYSEHAEELGQAFMRAVESNNVKGAAVLLKKIEKL